MQQRLFAAGYPATPLGWVTFGLGTLLGLVGTILFNNRDATTLISLILLSWMINLVTAYWPFQARLLCHLITWIMLWRAILPAQPWYLVIPLSLMLAGAVVWEQERRQDAQGPVG